MIFIWNTTKQPIFLRSRRSVAQRLQELRQMYLYLIHDFVHQLLDLPPIITTARNVMATAIDIWKQENMIEDQPIWRIFQNLLEFFKLIFNKPEYQIILFSQSAHLEQPINSNVPSLSQI